MPAAPGTPNQEGGGRSHEPPEPAANYHCRQYAATARSTRLLEERFQQQLLLAARLPHRQSGLHHEVYCPLQLPLAVIQLRLEQSLLRPIGLPRVIEPVTPPQDVFCRLVFLNTGT